MAVKCSEPLWTLTPQGPGQVQAEQVIAEVATEQWLRLSAERHPVTGR
jgi:hypothetical protein